MKTIILAGSGHAHLEVLKKLKKSEVTANRILLISPERKTYYSGLIPRLISGHIEPRFLTVYSADVAERKGIFYIQDSIQSFNPESSFVTLVSGEQIKFDVLSLNIGGARFNIPSACPDCTIYLRPFDDFLKQWQEIQELFNLNSTSKSSPHQNSSANSKSKYSFVVVGGGPAAVEVATALRIRLNDNNFVASQVILVSKGPRLCETYPEAVSNSLFRTLVNFNIRILLNEPVSEILFNHIKLKNDEKLSFDYIFIATPTAPSMITPNQVDATLCIAPNIFAAGDGVTRADSVVLPRSGVVAVRQGRHLVGSIRKALRGKNPSKFKVPKRYLNIVITGKKTALLVWGNFTIQGRWARIIKDFIDRRYIKSFGK